MAYDTVDFFPHCAKWSPLKKLYDDITRDTKDTSSLDQWRNHNTSTLQNGNQQRNNSDRLVDDGYRLVKDRKEANALSETLVKQNLENRVDQIGYHEDELEGALWDVRREDDMLQYCHNRLKDSIKTNIKPIWELAKKCLELRTQRPSSEAVEDDVNYLLREEMKQAERTAKIFDNDIARVEEQHRRNNAITYRCKYLKTRDFETKQAVSRCRELAQKDGQHQKKDLLTQLEPVKQNFAQWSAHTQDANRTAMREIAASHKLRLEGNDDITKSDEAITRLYRDIHEALIRSNTALELAKSKLVDEHNRIHERIQQINEVLDHLTNLHNVTVMPERTAQHELGKTALKTNLNKAGDTVHTALHATIIEHNDTHSQAGVELDKCRKQLVTLRSVDNQLLEDIHRKEKALHVDEVLVLELRKITKLRQV